jgi:hypothetical protein
VSVRGLAKLALGALAVAALAALGLALWLPHALRGELLAARLREAVRESTGREASFSALEVELFPLSIRVEDAKLVGSPGEDDGGVGLAVERADLRLAWLPLLARTVVVERVSIEGARLGAARTAQGMVWPWSAPPPTSSRRPDGEAKDGEGGAARGGGHGFVFAVRRLDLSRGRLLLEDRTADPRAVIELVDLAGTLRARATDPPVEVSLAGGLASGGTLRAEGTVAADGDLDLVVALEGVGLAPFASYLGSEVRLGGAANGQLHAKGPARAPDALDVDIALGEAAFAIGEARVAGPVSLRAELRGALARPAGRFSIDASNAELVYGGAFRKAPGAAATAEGRLATRPDGRLSTEEVRLRIQNIGGGAQLESGGGRPAELRLDLPSFPATELAALSPALAPLAPEGQLALSGLHVVAGRPPAFDGRVSLDPLRLRPDGRGPIELRGALVGDGAVVRSDALAATIGGQRVAIDLELSGLPALPHHRTRLAARDADAGALLGALAGEPSRMEGPVTLDADLHGPLAPGDAALGALAGEVRVAAGPGRIVGVSPLHEALARIEALGGGRSEALARFESDRFESLAGRFELGGGLARTDDLELRYPGYALRLRGTIGLVDSDLDARGQLVLEEELVAALADRATRASGGPRVLELAHVGGTVAKPQIEVEAQAALTLAAALATAGRRDEVERKIDHVLGQGAGRSVLDVIDGLLAPSKERQ